jgi:hypothetical protein
MKLLARPSFPLVMALACRWGKQAIAILADKFQEYNRFYERYAGRPA